MVCPCFNLLSINGRRAGFPAAPGRPVNYGRQATCWSTGSAGWFVDYILQKVYFTFENSSAKKGQVVYVFFLDWPGCCCYHEHIRKTIKTMKGKSRPDTAFQGGSAVTESAAIA